MEFTGFDDLLAGRPLVAILRGLAPEAAVALAHAVWDTGLGVVEVPIQSPDAVAALAAVAASGADRGEAVGAGTVITPAQVGVARAAGAAFTVAPGLDAEVLLASRSAGMPHLPGVATPTDVQHALRAGCTWLKAFPASLLGPAWLREMAGPFPQARFVATGGVSAANAGQWLSAGARAVGVGSSLTKGSGLADLVKVLGHA